MDLSPRGEEAARLAARVGAPLAAARHRAGLTMAALARRAGVSAATVGKLERGRQRPTVGTLTRLADALLPHDQAAALALVDQLAAAAGPSLAGDVTVPAAVAREQVVEILYRSAVALGLDLEDERIRAVVVEQIRAVTGGAPISVIMRAAGDRQTGNLPVLSPCHRKISRTMSEIEL